MTQNKKEKKMQFDKSMVEEQLAVRKKLKRNLNEFERLTKEVEFMVNRSTWNGVPMSLFNQVTDKYEFGDLIVENGEIYYITERLPQTQYEHNIGVRNYLTQRVKWDLGLSEEEYEIEEQMEYDSEDNYDFSSYIIRERKGDK